MRKGHGQAVAALGKLARTAPLNAAIEAARAGEQGKGFGGRRRRGQASRGRLAGRRQADRRADRRADRGDPGGDAEDGGGGRRGRAGDGVAVVDQAREAFETIGVQADEMVRRISEVVDATGQVAAVAEETSAYSEQAPRPRSRRAPRPRRSRVFAQALAGSADLLHQLVSQFTLVAA